MPDHEEPRDGAPTTGSDAAGEAAAGLVKEPDTEQLQSDFDRLRQEHTDLNEKYLRAMAEFDNARKRMRAEQAQRLQFANEQLVLELLPVLDNLERALEMDPVGDATALRGGVELTARMLTDVLARFGVAPISAVDQPFDPLQHEAVGQVESTEHPEGTILEEQQRGYRLHDRVIRPSRVTVAMRPAADQQQAES